MKEMICIVCPNSCHLQIDEFGAVGGYLCERGEAYAKHETANPMRVLTSTVRVANGNHRRCSVKTDRPLPKGLLTKAMELLNSIELTAPIECGQIVIEDFLNAGVNLRTTRRIELSTE